VGEMLVKALDATAAVRSLVGITRQAR
jgi:hypothetical protein